MPHMEKYKQPQVALILAHNLRAKNTSYKSADPQLEKDNIYYVNNGDGLIQVRDDNHELLKRAYNYQKGLLNKLPHENRKNLVTLGEWLITCPRSIPKKDRVKFLQASVDFLCERYGTKNVACIALHLDEPNAMPHLHATFVPVDERGKICARNVLTRKELQHFHPDLERYTSQKLGYEVHILKDEDERTKESIPLSQFKVETKQKELEQREKQVEQQAQEAADKLETAENAISAAHFDAVEKTAAIMKNYDKTSALKRFFKDPRPFVRDMALELQKAAALEQAAVDQRDKELDAREEKVRQQEKEQQQKEAELSKREKEVQKRLAECQRLANQAEKDNAEEKENRRKNEMAESAAQEKLVAAERAEKRLAENRQSYEKWRKNLLPLETANARYEQEQKRADTYKQSSDDYRHRYDDIKQKADKMEAIALRQKKQLVKASAAVVDRDNTIGQLRQQLQQEQAEKRALATELENTSNYATMLRSELRAKNAVLSVNVSVEAKARIQAMKEQTEAARQKTAFPKALDIVEPPAERVREIQNELESRKRHGRGISR